MIKKPPIKAPFFFDTPKGVDHVTKTIMENSSEKITPNKLEELNKLNRDTKLSLLKSEEQSLKKFMNEDPSSYPSDPVQRGKLMNIQNLEKSLGVRSDSFKRFVKTGALPIGKKEPDLWKDVIYPSMSPMEKGTWNAEKRKEKIQKQKEEAEEKKQKRIDNHTKQQWGIPDKKSVNYLSNNYSFEENFKKQSKNINYQKMHNQDLKTNMRKWINEADKEKKQEVNKPLSTPEKPREHFVLPSQRVTPVSPGATQSLDQRLRNTGSLPPGLSIELVKLRKDIDRNINYVLGADQKDNLESRNKETTNKEELK